MKLDVVKTITLSLSEEDARKLYSLVAFHLDKYTITESLEFFADSLEKILEDFSK